jgi:WGR domain-containing protein
MDNLLTVALEAHHAEQNHHRRYRVSVGQDLFGQWTVSICFGRIGQSGRELRYSAPKLDELRKTVDDRLRRRLSAPRRIGCSYRLTSFNAAADFDSSSFVAGHVLARFIGSNG